MDRSAHLLGIPQEIRDYIYACILNNIHNGKRGLEDAPISSYDGLALACKQLYEETQKSVFCFKYTSGQLIRNLDFDFKLDLTNFLNVRSVTLVLPHTMEDGIDRGQIYQGVTNFLDTIQLSLQELHLIFVGYDQLGIRTNMNGCGEKKQPNIPDNLLLWDKGQDFGHQWGLIRKTAVLRNLRTLRIQNANIPLSASLLCHNKPHLKHLSVSSDQRSVFSSLTRCGISYSRLFSEVGLHVSSFPHIRVLSLCANSAADTEKIVAGVSQHLEHFSWRVPNSDFQPYRERKSFYRQTDYVINELSFKATRLTTLRLCLSMRDRKKGDEQVRQEFDTMTMHLSSRLHALSSLKHLEIHYRGDQGFGGFFRKEMIGRVPLSLSRIYLSDNMISVKELVEQVHKRFFTYLQDYEHSIPLPFYRNSGLDHDEDEKTCLAMAGNLNEELYLSAFAWSGKRRLLSCGEGRNRTDDIPLTGGNMGFVHFEYDYEHTDAQEDEFAASNYYYEPHHVKLLRLNGQLLDREHNLHFADHPRYSPDTGMRPLQADQARYSIGETAVSSQYPELKDAISQFEQLTAEEQLDVEIYQLELSECLDTTNNDWDWYFGNEAVAEKVFMREYVAKIEDQKQKPNMMVVDVDDQCRTDGCEWVCPEYGLPPVGSFPEPKIPWDWQHDCLRRMK